MVNEEADCGALEALACPQLSSVATGDGFSLGKDLACHFSLLIGSLSFENLFGIWLFQSRNVVAEEQKSISVVSHRGEAGPIRIFNRYYSLVQFRTLVPVMFIEVHLSL